MAINFPDSPSNGDSFTSNNKTWVFDGTSWNITSGTNSVADGAITTAKVAANAVTQAKLAVNVSGITITTTANRSTDIPSPFTAQFIFLTDTNTLQRWSGSAWTNVLASPPGAPTALSATALSTTSVSVAFTPGASAGASTTNYKYALSTDGGSAYGEATAVDPADFTSPITISGLTVGTTYHIKLKAVTDVGDSEFSSATSVLVAVAPDAPTSLSATGIVGGATITFTPGANNGSAITNYQYALSTNGGSTYGSFAALDPADATSPITISGLTSGTTYTIKLKAVNAIGAGTESASVSVTPLSITVDYLVVAGGASGGSTYGGGGGAGGLRSTVTATGGGGTLETAPTLTASTNYSVQVGAGGAAVSANASAIAGNDGSNSVFSTITSIGGGGGGARYSSQTAPRPGGSGGGAGDNYPGGGSAGAAGTANQGYAGGGTTFRPYRGHGGGGAGAVGGNSASPTNGDGGVGVAVAITGSSVFYAGGGGGGEHSGTNSSGAGGNGGGGAGAYGTTNDGVSGTVNRGGGGGGGGDARPQAGAGGSGVVILRYPSAYTITIGAGLTGSTTTVGSNKVTTITAGSGNVSWS